MWCVCVCVCLDVGGCVCSQDISRPFLKFPVMRIVRETNCEESRAGHFRFFKIFSLIKNDFLHFLSS